MNDFGTGTCSKLQLQLQFPTGKWFLFRFSHLLNKSKRYINTHLDTMLCSIENFTFLWCRFLTNRLCNFRVVWSFFSLSVTEKIWKLNWNRCGRWTTICQMSYALLCWVCVRCWSIYRCYRFRMTHVYSSVNVSNARQMQCHFRDGNVKGCVLANTQLQPL